MKVIQVNQSSKHRASKSNLHLQKMCNLILKKLESRRLRNKKLLNEKKELTIVFLSEIEMKKINTQFRAKNYATDILSFASTDPESLGELLICLPVIQKQAREHGHEFEHEMLYMLLHGLLHLLGYDHELSKKEDQLMMKIQQGCFEELSSSLAQKKQKK